MWRIVILVWTSFLPSAVEEETYQVQMQRKVGHHTEHVPDPIPPPLSGETQCLY